jgi:hypothetical protein
LSRIAIVSSLWFASTESYREFQQFFIIGGKRKESTENAPPSVVVFPVFQAGVGERAPFNSRTRCRRNVPASGEHQEHQRGNEKYQNRAAYHSFAVRFPIKRNAGHNVPAQAVIRINAFSTRLSFSRVRFEIEEYAVKLLVHIPDLFSNLHEMSPVVMPVRCQASAEGKHQ